MNCKDCGQDVGMTFNGRCGVCANSAQEEWSSIYKRRQDASQLDAQKLVNYLLTQVWQHQCEIVAHGTNHIIRHRQGDDYQFLRYSNGPLQGFFWDVYGDDFHSPELAIVALSQCPPPRGAICVSTHGR